MPLRFRLHLDTPDLALLDPPRAAAVGEATLLPAVEEASLYAWRTITANTPVGATAILRGSIQQATETVRGIPVQFRGEVFTTQPHAVPVEEGTRPHWAPIAPLKLWARRKLGGDDRVAYAVQRTIAKRGTKPTHFWRDATDQATPRITQILRDAFTAYVERLRGR